MSRPPYRTPLRVVLWMHLTLLALATPPAVAQDTLQGFDLWDLHAAAAQPGTHLGRSTLVIRNVTAFLPGVQFQDGTIEVDVAPAEGLVFAGVVFRTQTDDDAEEVYLRLNKSGLPDAIQYAPRTRGLTAWQLYSGDGFTAPVRFPSTGWIRLRVEVAGDEARVLVDDAETLVAPLQRDAGPGTLGLWGLGGATFSNFRFRPATPSPPAARAEAAPPPAFVGRWEISPVYPADSLDAERYPGAVLLASNGWAPLTAEPSGLVNVSHLRHIAAAGGGDGLVFARGTINAEAAGVRKLSFGYSDEVSVFLNGRLLFSGNSRWRARDPLLLGTVGLHDHLYLDLREGENELLFALTEWFGGWGLMARFDDPSGLRY